MERSADLSIKFECVKGAIRKIEKKLKKKIFQGACNKGDNKKGGGVNLDRNPIQK